MSDAKLRQDFQNTMMTNEGWNDYHFALRSNGVYDNSSVETMFKGFRHGRLIPPTALTFNEVVKLVEDKVDYVSSVSGILQILIDNGVLTVQKD